MTTGCTLLDSPRTIPRGQRPRIGRLGHECPAEVDEIEHQDESARTRDGKQVVTDGPFVETKEKVGGLFIIEARDLNEAIRIASMHPGARLGEDRGWAVEIRPIAATCHQ